MNISELEKTPDVLAGNQRAHRRLKAKQKAKAQQKAKAKKHQMAEAMVTRLLEDDDTEKECAKCSKTPCACPPIGKRGPYPPLM